MRKIATLSLVPLLVLCPLLCGAAETGRDTHLHRTWANSPPDAGTPDRNPDRDCCPEDGGSVPDDGDHCFCKGAVQAEGPRASDSDYLGLMSPIGGLFLTTPPALSHHFSRLTRPGSPTGWAAWGGASRVRAVLQNFRC